ncbi:PIN domain-containing protein [Nocardia cyriacigeorgica]|uniref:Ribonuclease VapC n=1 Tax=Nocardia cyriacigeorgica TaxID=135487 RepID=A0A5R8NK57_9NOCA|nr:PIN domain-containing protein [Nocardia cyriacigeorgica]TLF76021.1 PIN domain nuclease [Nocardia cyriacigeorgica]
MALTARYVIDTSAAARMSNAEVADRLTPLITGGLVATCATLDAEALYSARNPAQYEQLRADRRAAYEYLPTDDEHWQRAFAIQRELARRGKHRAVGIADLITAVLTAEHRLVLIHYDADFETVASVIDLNHRWVVPRGSL